MKQLLLMPQLVTMQQQNPEVAQQLLSSIQNDPTPARVQSVLKSLIEAQRQQLMKPATVPDPNLLATTT